MVQRFEMSIWEKDDGDFVYYHDYAALEAENARLSRIVRAAERLVKARKALVDAFALMDMDFPHFSVSEKARDMDFEIEQANKALTDAVEGGAEG